MLHGESHPNSRDPRHRGSALITAGSLTNLHCLLLWKCPALGFMDRTSVWLAPNRLAKKDPVSTSQSEEDNMLSVDGWVTNKLRTPARRQEKIGNRGSRSFFTKSSTSYESQENTKTPKKMNVISHGDRTGSIANRGIPVLELGEFIIANKSQLPEEDDEREINKLMTAIKLAAKVVNREINKAGLCDILGTAGIDNVQGEAQQKLDVFANEAFIHSLVNRDVVCGICSEENENFIAVNKHNHYVIAMDPLDGSSNIDSNVSVGTIFSIYKRLSPKGARVTLEDFLQPGRKQVAAGYVLYGSSTMLVLTFGKGVNGFTLDPSLGTFYLSHPLMEFPRNGKIYSVNEGNSAHFPIGINKFLDWCKEEAEGRPFTSRYIGSLVSDFHRNILHGGLYLYPSTKKSPNGKLRLLYECNPIALIAEQAGGAATNGIIPILDIEPTDLHQRCPLYVGPNELVAKVDESLALHKD
eukprot:GHVN01066838.1.p2 GENE.GHVN01066838.1~~GHVN01066838.1.p2  ORF type:complete len:468 (+),score=38.86 GHVN01066838.1:1492-2895(+)